MEFQKQDSQMVIQKIKSCLMKVSMGFNVNLCQRYRVSTRSNFDDCCPSFISVDMIQYSDKINLEKQFILAHRFRLLSITAGKSRQELETAGHIHNQKESMNTHRLNPQLTSSTLTQSRIQPKGLLAHITLSRVFQHQLI